MHAAAARLTGDQGASDYGPKRDLNIDDGGLSATRVPPGLLAGPPPSTPHTSERTCEVSPMIANPTDEPPRMTGVSATPMGVAA